MLSVVRVMGWKQGRRGDQRGEREREREGGGGRSTIAYQFNIKLYTLDVFLGKSKCMMKSGDCVVKHPGSHATGMSLVVREKL